MNFLILVFCFVFALPFGRGEGFFSKLTNSGKKLKSDVTNDNADVCETVRIMPRIAMAVVGGAPLKIENSAPYIAAVGERIVNGSISWFCGGSLISPHHVLTAAHCLISRNVSTVRLGSFSTKTRATDNDYEIIDSIIHPEYKITVSYNDIGILKLRNRVTLDNNTKPVCLPQTNENYEKERAKVIGWGAEEFGGEGTHKLQQVEVEVFSNNNCEKAYRNSTIAPKNFPKGIKNSQLCAGNEKGGKDACQGDSGGPLVLTDEQGIVRQIGVVSTGAGCGFKMYPGVYTRVSSYIDWIKEQIKDPDSGNISQKNNEDSSKKDFQPSRLSETSREPQSQGNLLSAQSFNDNKVKNQVTPHNSKNSEKDYSSQKQTEHSKKTFSGNGYSREIFSVNEQSREILTGTEIGHSKEASLISELPQSENYKNNKMSETNFGKNTFSSNRKTNQDSREYISREKDNRKEFEQTLVQTQDEYHRIRRYAYHKRTDRKIEKIYLR